MRRHRLLALLAGGGDHRAAAPPLRLVLAGMLLAHRGRGGGAAAAAGTAIAAHHHQAAAGGAAGRRAVLPLQVVLDDVAALHLLGRHPRLGHQGLGQDRVRAGHRGLGAAAGQVHVQLALGGAGTQGRRAGAHRRHGCRGRGRGHTVRYGTLARTYGTQAIRSGRRAAGIRLGGLELAVPQGAELLVRLVGLVHQGVGVVEWRRLQDALQHRHVLHDLALQMATARGLGRADRRNGHHTQLGMRHLAHLGGASIAAVQGVVHTGTGTGARGAASGTHRLALVLLVAGLDARICGRVQLPVACRSGCQVVVQLGMLLVVQLLLLLLLLRVELLLLGVADLLLLLLLVVVADNRRDGQPVLGEMRMGAHDVHVSSARVSTGAGVGAIPQRAAAG